MGRVAALSLILLLKLSAGGLPSSLVVVLDPDGSPSPDAIAAMQREAARILSSNGIDIDWRWRGAASEEFPEDVAYIRLKGRCRMEVVPAPAGEPGALGWTYTSSGVVIPFADVACDAVRTAVRGAMPGLDLKRADSLYGRALGRILAHELYHIAHRTRRHGHGGFIQPALSSRELVADTGPVLLAAGASHH